MCGIAGIFSPNSHSGHDLAGLCERMTGTLRHRGPDDGGVWEDPESGVALGHRRLAIIDLTSEGHQPMASECGRYVIVFNGEVYNHVQLRKELEDAGIAPNFRGHSDTEVMLAAIVAWGLEPAVARFIGMFAFALWDRKERVLSLVRDRMGIKPLYYGWAGRALVFGSELKALRAHPDFCPEIDRNCLALYFKYSYVPAPYSIYRDAFKLQPGHIAKLSAEELSGNPQGMLHEVPYWSPLDSWSPREHQPWEATEAETTDCLEELLKDSIRLRMIADVPLGAFLSGGIDSSVVVALMQAIGNSPVKTFTIGFHEGAYNEAPYAAQVARHLGTDHTELYLTARQAMEVVPDLPRIYDEPFADSSQIPTFLVSRLARGHVTVSLSGDGGDELFGGYDRYFYILDRWERYNRIPYTLRRPACKVAAGMRDSVLRLFPNFVLALAGEAGQRKIESVFEILLADDLTGFYENLVSCFRKAAWIVPGAEEIETRFNAMRGREDSLHPFQTMELLDLLTYLPDDILTKVDRAAMAVALEARVPLLDHRVVELAGRIPVSMKRKGSTGKWILRQILYRYVPREMVERPKMGFGIPVDQWLRGPLKDWASDLLDEHRLKQEGYLNHRRVSVIWEEHLSGRRNWMSLIWTVLMFQAWLKEHRTSAA